MTLAEQEKRETSRINAVISSATRSMQDICPLLVKYKNKDVLEALECLIKANIESSKDMKV